MWSGRKAKRQDFKKKKLASHTIPKLPAESQEKLMIFLNLYVVITTFQIKQNHVAVLLGESKREFPIFIFYFSIYQIFVDMT